MFKYSVSIIFIIMVGLGIYVVYSKYTEPSIDDALKIVFKHKKIYKELKDIRFNKPNYKALSMAIDKDGHFVYWYTYGMYSQKAAERIALKNCEKARENLDVSNKCKLYNEILVNLN